MKLYRNWKTIALIKNIHLRLALSTIDPISEDGQILVKGLPQFFIDTEVTGPIPLSCIWAKSLEFCKKQGYGRPEYTSSYNALPEGLPVIGYNYPLDGCAIGNTDLYQEKTLPDGFDVKSLRFGDAVEIEGAKLVVVENNDSCCELICVPAEAVINDLADFDFPSPKEEEEKKREPEEEVIHECVLVSDFIDAQNNPDKLNELKQFVERNNCPSCQKAMTIGMNQAAD